MPLLDFGDDSNDILWMGEAIDAGVVPEGTKLEIRNIARTTDGRGFLIECDYQGETIFDYAWKKGKTGQALSTMFSDPTEADGNHLLCKAQKKVKNAVLLAEELPGCRWELSTVGDKEILSFFASAKKPVQLRTAKDSPSAVAS